MAKQLNLSINELWSLLTRAFEALYGHERDYYDMARTVLWLECHGHDGVAQFVNSLPLLQNTQRADPQLSEQSSGQLLMDGKGHSLLCIGRSVADLSMAFAAEHGASRIEVTHAHDCQSFIGLLAYIASQGFQAKVICQDMVAIIEPVAKHPTVYANDGLAGLTLICTQNDDKYDEDLKLLKTIETQKEVYLNGLENGINICRAHYDELNHIANKVLVEATEASRRGAGE